MKSVMEEIEQLVTRVKDAKNLGKRQKVFDWDRAAKLIAARRPKEASAGLREDWMSTADTIFIDGKPTTDCHPYLSSIWASPSLDMDGDIIDCWCYADESAGWNSDTKWPESALTALKGFEP